ncbi:MAG: HDOD domain-containing protein [Bdellovibrionales bacterium]|nr:HDOD domain-containing protein [Bdellovibrionales bacterium]
MGLFEAFKREKKKTVSPTTLATELRIKNILGIQNLDSMPAQAARAFQIASDPKAKTSDFVTVIESDEALSSRIIRVANSVYFQRGAPATEIEKAVAQIGLDELRGLLSATMLKSLLKSKTDARKQIWANAVGTAMVASSITKYAQGISSGQAFLCGLIHDVGKLIMLMRNQKLYQQVMVQAASGNDDFCTIEERLFEINHVEVGQWVAERWKFPPAAIEAIAGHHNSWPSSVGLLQRGSEPALLTKIADLLAHAAGLGHPSSYKGFQDRCKMSVERCRKELGISQDEMNNLLEQCRMEFDQLYSLYEEDV